MESIVLISWFRVSLKVSLNLRENFAWSVRKNTLSKGLNGSNNSEIFRKKWKSYDFLHIKSWILRISLKISRSNEILSCV